jgi:cell division protein FtsZ
LDLSIGEFEEVGEVVKGFTSDSATVVVGTVIDPEMRDEVRVTVIVTGLGRKQVAAGTRFASVEGVRTQQDKAPQPDYADLDKPAVLRRQAEVAGHDAPVIAIPTSTTSSHQQKSTTLSENIHDVDYLDIPAFLRRREEG